MIFLDDCFCFHRYMAYIAQFPCAVCQYAGHEQTTRTTVDHIVTGGKARKGPDYWTIPVEKKKHVHGKESIDRLGRWGFQEHWDLPRYGAMALIYLTQYIEQKGWAVMLNNVDREAPSHDRDSAIYFCRELQRILQNDHDVRSWNWTA